jgi:NTE family protein
MRALVISGGGSKGAFAGGVAQYLIEEKGKKYDIFLGTSTGSLLIPHLAAGNLKKIYEVIPMLPKRKSLASTPLS